MVLAVDRSPFHDCGDCGGRCVRAEAFGLALEMSVGPLQEQDGSWSLRRCLAAFFALLFGGTIAGVLLRIDRITNPWVVVAMLGIPVAAILILMFFTTWGDIAEVVAAASRPKREE